MKRKTKKLLFASIIGATVFVSLTSSVLYNAFRRVKKNLFRDFYYWGEEFIDD